MSLPVEQNTPPVRAEGAHLGQRVGISAPGSQHAVRSGPVGSRE
jgi:hypothetical protein